jgi:hypothetical protein
MPLVTRLAALEASRRGNQWHPRAYIPVENRAPCVLGKVPDNQTPSLATLFPQPKLVSPPSGTKTTDAHLHDYTNRQYIGGKGKRMDASFLSCKEACCLITRMYANCRPVSMCTIIEHRTPDQFYRVIEHRTPGQFYRIIEHRTPD